MHERKDRQTYSREGDYLYRLLDDMDNPKTSGAEIMVYTGSGDVVQIPGKLSGFPVIRIGMEAFSNNQTIRHVTMPKTVMVIGKRAFMGCTSLESVQLSWRMQVIRAGAFAGCKALRDIIIPARTKVSDLAFFRCDHQVRIFRHLVYGLSMEGKSSDLPCHIERLRKEKDKSV